MDAKKPFAGQLDKTIKVYRLEVTQSATGATGDKQEVDICTTRACQNTETGKQEIEEKVRHLVNASFTIRKRTGIIGTDNLCVEYSGNKFRVYYVREIGRTHLELQCTDFDE